MKDLLKSLLGCALYAVPMGMLMHQRETVRLMAPFTSTRGCCLCNPTAGTPCGCQPGACGCEVCYCPVPGKNCGIAAKAERK